MSLYASLMPNLHRWPKGRQICCPCTDTRARVLPLPSCPFACPLPCALVRAKVYAV